MGFFSKLFGSNNVTSKPVAVPTTYKSSSQQYASQPPAKPSQVTKSKIESEFDFYSNKDPILHIKHLKEVFPIYHSLEEGRWPFLATNGVVKVFSWGDTAAEYCEGVDRKIFVKEMTQPEFIYALKSWYRDGITKILLDGENGSELLISDILNDPSYPKKAYLGIDINRTIIIYRQLEEDNQGFLTDIVHNGLREDLPKNVFLTPITTSTSNETAFPCTALASELLSEMDASSFIGAETINIGSEENINLEDIRLFDIDNSGNKVILLYTNLADIKSLFGDKKVSIGVVAYGDVIYRSTNKNYTDRVSGIVINFYGSEYYIVNEESFII